MKKKPPKKPPLIGQILTKVAPRLGATVLLEPTWQSVGQITYPTGQRRYFRLSSLDLNPMGAAAVAKDKDYASFFMARMGYPTPTGKAFFSDAHAARVAPERNIDAAFAYAQQIGLPVIVKPNSGTGGKDLALVHTKRDFYRAARRIFKEDEVMLVQERVTGKDYRLVVLDDAVISAYERVPLNVVGDGRKTVAALLERKQAEFHRRKRNTTIDMKDPRIVDTLKRQALTLRSIPKAGQLIMLLSNANLSSGGEAKDVTADVHPQFRALAVALTRDMGLRLCGVDLMIAGDIAVWQPEFWILEINSAPGLDHYASYGPEQMQTVERLYLEVLKSMQ